MNQSFETIGLLGKYRDPRVADSFVSLAGHLSAKGAKVLISEDAAKELQALSVEKCAEQAMVDRADLMIAIGGDGTMLYAARLVAERDIPVLGINRGRLGFLTDVSPDEMLERVDEVLAGQYSCEHRLMLRAELSASEQPVKVCAALNDVVLQRSHTGRMLEFETWIDDRYVNTHGGDGLVVATATGSTAYALSCGGPIIQPEVDAVVVTPICPHTLSDRPLLVRASSNIEARLPERPDTGAQVTCDGHLLGELRPGDTLRIGQSPKRFTLVHPPGHDFYRILRSKLHWGRGSLSRPDRAE